MDSRFDPPGYTFTVHKLDADASDPVVLDSGKDIARSSFAVAAHFIYWTKGGKPQSATRP